MDDLFWNTSAMEAMSLDAFKNNERGDDAHVTDTFFHILKQDSTTRLFGPGWSKYTQLGTIVLLYNLKEMYGMSHMFLGTFEVPGHMFPYILRNIVM